MNGRASTRGEGWDDIFITSRGFPFLKLNHSWVAWGAPAKTNPSRARPSDMSHIVCGRNLEPHPDSNRCINNHYNLLLNVLVMVNNADIID